MGVFDELFADDENLFERADEDYMLIAPGKAVVRGNDGVLDSADPWVLTSASINFESRGLQSGHVVEIYYPTTSAHAQYKDRKDHFAVASAAGGSATLRRVGSDAGFGAPPAPPSGSITSVVFKALTCDAQLANSTDYIREKLGSDGLTAAEIAAAGRSESFEQACAARTLARLYLTKAKEGGPELGGAGRLSGSAFWSKGQEWKREWEERFALLEAIYVPSGVGTGRRARSGELGTPTPYPRRRPMPRPGVASDWGDTTGWPDETY